jgi:hypothetical protein
MHYQRYEYLKGKIDGFLERYEEKTDTDRQII